jgi:hypothetical protein
VYKLPVFTANINLGQSCKLPLYSQMKLKSFSTFALLNQTKQCGSDEDSRAYIDIKETGSIM